MSRMSKRLWTLVLLVILGSQFNGVGADPQNRRHSHIFDMQDLLTVNGDTFAEMLERLKAIVEYRTQGGCSVAAIVDIEGDMVEVVSKSFDVITNALLTVQNLLQEVTSHFKENPCAGNTSENCPGFGCGSGECIPMAFYCNGEVDCFDASDEMLNCTNVEGRLYTGNNNCKENEFSCKTNGRCIPRWWMCDGASDCKDGSDEEGCPVPTCSSEQFQCHSLGVCIDKQWQCDGDTDCLDGSDELDCPFPGGTVTTFNETFYPACGIAHFQCKDLFHCIPKHWECDGDDDCPDSSDEMDCLPPQTTKSPNDPVASISPDTTEGTVESLHILSSTVMCDKGGHLCEIKHRPICVPMEWFCDGVSDCDDGYDEMNCGEMGYSTSSGSTDEMIFETAPVPLKENPLVDVRHPGPPSRQTSKTFTYVTGERMDSPERMESPVSGPVPVPKLNDKNILDVIEAASILDFAARSSASLPEISADGNSTYDFITGTLGQYFAIPGQQENITSNLTELLFNQLSSSDQGNSGEMSFLSGIHNKMSNLFGAAESSVVHNLSSLSGEENYKFNMTLIWRPNSCNSTHEFQCKENGKCIPQSRHCDGKPDCKNASDEQNCPMDTCEDGWFLCETMNRHTSIPKLWLCDGIVDCVDNSDENFCRDSEFQGRNKSHSMPSESTIFKETTDRRPRVFSHSESNETQDSEESELSESVESNETQDSKESELSESVESNETQDSKESELVEPVESNENQDSKESELVESVESNKTQDSKESELVKPVESNETKDSEESELVESVESNETQDSKESELDEPVESNENEDSEESELVESVESNETQDSKESELVEPVESNEAEDSEESELVEPVESNETKDSEESELVEPVESNETQDSKESELSELLESEEEGSQELKASVHSESKDHPGPESDDRLGAESKRLSEPEESEASESEEMTEVESAESSDEKTTDDHLGAESKRLSEPEESEDSESEEITELESAESSDEKTTDETKGEPSEYSSYESTTTYSSSVPTVIITTASTQHPENPVTVTPSVSTTSSASSSLKVSSFSTAPTTVSSFSTAATLTSPFSMATTAAALLPIYLSTSSSWKNEVACGSKSFRCKTNGVCIPQALTCNGQPDCPHGSDEWNCKEACKDDEVHCASDSKCIPSSWVCDGEEDCSDGRDEQDCVQDGCKHPDWFKCKSGECISPLWRCNGYKNCIDGSDEWNCHTTPAPSTTEQPIIYNITTTYPVPAVNQFSCPDGKFRCPVSRACISPSWVCDGHNDCNDNSDEINCPSPTPLLTTPYSTTIESGFSDTTVLPPLIKVTPPRSFIATTEKDELPSPSSPTRLLGRVLEIPAVDNLKAESTEQQVSCENKPGYFQCNDREKCINVSNVCDGVSDCLDGTDEGNGCDVQEKGFLLVSLGKRLEAFSLDVRTSFRVHRERFGNIVGVSYDPIMREVYWTVSSHTRGGVYRKPLTGQRHAELFLSSSTTLEGLAIDWLGRNLYIADRNNDRIRVCYLSTSVCATLMKSVRSPRTLQLDLKDRKIYWTDDRTPLIGVADLDGKGRASLVSSRLGWPNGLALDLSLGRIYWMDGKYDTLEYLDLADNSRQIAANTSSVYPYSVALWEDRIYWTDLLRKQALSCSKWNCDDIQLFTSTAPATPLGMSLYHPTLFEEVTNYCIDNECSHFCLFSRSSAVNYTCACPDGMVLLEGGQTCA